MLNDQELNATPKRVYYEELGRAHDYLLRCKDCSRLVTFKRITKLSSCKCGNKKFIEITTLSGWELFKLKFGLIRFPDKDKFLAEFSRVKA